MVAPVSPPIVSARDLRKEFRRSKTDTVRALDGVSFELAAGSLLALVGPDGAGKTTLIRLLTGLLSADSGQLSVLGLDLARHAGEVQARVGYMPQKFGLYEDLTVQENLDLYADLHGVYPGDRRERYARLMEMTALAPFTSRLAGRLSGGMKQKLGLACTLVRSPELLLLDEPTVGVDPLSRQELWEIITRLVQTENLTVVLSTSYLDEASRCQRALVLHEGRVLAEGPPEEVSRLAEGRTFLAQPAKGRPARLLQARLLDLPCIVDAVPSGGRARFVTRDAASPDALLANVGETVETISTPPRFEDGFMVLFRRQQQRKQEHEHPQQQQQEAQRPPPPPSDGVAGALALDRPPPAGGSEIAVKVSDLVRRFGNFVAVDHVSFSVRRGEIFGLLGPNGAGKTTTFRMLCGLLPATSGTLEIAGVDLNHARDSARQRLGYVAQKFSLYGQLSVKENLEFFASAYGLAGSARRRRVAWAMEQFDLGRLAGLPSGELPGGFKQRLAMAAALLHQPEILFLDEPTSGADPLARREFWRRITALSAQGVTVIVTTHFMEEAEYCDNIVIQDAGRVLARGTPAEVRAQAEARAGREPTMEDAFIAIVEKGRGDAAGARREKLNTAQAGPSDES